MYLTFKNRDNEGKPIHLRADGIKSIEQKDGYCLISLGKDHEYHVEEPATEVVRLLNLEGK